jgi:hypothetical protein
VNKMLILLALPGSVVVDGQLVRPWLAVGWGCCAVHSRVQLLSKWPHIRGLG